MAQNDPMQRLANVEQLAQSLRASYNTLLQENQSLKARLKAVEVECGMVTEPGEEYDDPGIG